MKRLQQPETLNGALTVVLLPLATGADRDLAHEDRSAVDFSSSPFLDARGTRVVIPGGGSAASDRLPHRWPVPVLVSSRIVGGKADTLLFGRSASTLAEQSEGDQAIVGGPTFAVSLWWVPGGAAVLALERLDRFPGTDSWARDVDELGRCLARPGEVADEHTQYGSSSDVKKMLDGFLRPFGGSATATLSDFFGHGVRDALGLNGERFTDLLVRRRTVLMGVPLVEGMVVGVSAAVAPDHGDSTDALGLMSFVASRTLSTRSSYDPEGFDEIDAWQEQGYRWIYRAFDLVSQPARDGAKCAMRSDGRVILVDQDAMSIYHDYSGSLGGEIIWALIPLVGVMGRRGDDFEQVTAILDDLGRGGGRRSGPSTGNRLSAVRAVRARVETDALLLDQALNEPNFKDWTNLHSLRALIAPVVLADEIDPPGSTVDIRSGPLLDVVRSVSEALRLLRDEERLLRDEEESEVRRARDRRTSRRAAVVATGLGILGLASAYSAVFSVTEAGRGVVSAAVTAGAWTLMIVAAVTVVIVTVSGEFTEAMRNRRRERRIWVPPVALLVSFVLAATSLSPLRAAFSIVLVSAAAMFFFVAISRFAAGEEIDASSPPAA